MTPSQPIARLQRIPHATEIGQSNEIPFEIFPQNEGKGLQIKIMPLKETAASLTDNVVDFVWLVSKFLKIENTPSWSGFMESATRGGEYEKSKIVFLPFIRSPPSNYSTLYSALIFAQKTADAVGRQVCIVTFDLPLNLKAREIVESLPQEMAVRFFIRLGGFHQLVSFLSAIGYIMNGSGIKEFLMTIFVSNSIEKILFGHAFARSVRGHSLIHEVLGKIFISEMRLPEVECEKMKKAMSSEEFVWPFQNQHVHHLWEQFESHLKNIENHSPTSKLWCQYSQMVPLMKNFIAAERMGNWTLHLECVQQMLPFFHATGNIHYAKAAHLYLQDALQSQGKMSEIEFQEFVNYFALRRSSKYWSGIFSDMTIEQTLMRRMSSLGGLTRGRGVQESVVQK